MCSALQWHPALPEDQLIESLPQSIHINHQTIVLVRHFGALYALEDRCSHDAIPLSHGAVLDNAEIMCPRHGARFCLATGKALSPPAFHPVKTFPIQVIDRMIHIGLTPLI